MEVTGGTSRVQPLRQRKGKIWGSTSIIMLSAGLSYSGSMQHPQGILGGRFPLFDTRCHVQSGCRAPKRANQGEEMS